MKGEWDYEARVVQHMATADARIAELEAAALRMAAWIWNNTPTIVAREVPHDVKTTARSVLESGRKREVKSA